ncbi:DUF2716 domain-containing protein [Actinoplanes utahensis]|uniref:DUF2716 domain-containing protein n=1 Tax=Actinoplanes utahensis TaxID=1869 RepID=A0A0A6UKK5_ACTUT|nr:DUF2716 domain-containing protein [Actinoplanes utahensis]KHD75613.1 hypothetical protein MB27_21565 [Actinoplanes utahensis]GIF27135.1 hypothetical protein Aut01nite_01210 [Actinoplanes utahensis]
MNEPVWEEIANERYEDFWGPFDARFEFGARHQKPGSRILEPIPSVTFDLSPLFTDSPVTFAAGQAAVNAVALFAMTQAFPAGERLLALDWQHVSHWYWPHRRAVAEDEIPPIDVFPNGDFYVFLTEDMTEGTFGHPWERTLCVFGPRLMPRLVPLLAGWLPIRRSAS